MAHEAHHQNSDSHKTDPQKMDLSADALMKNPKFITTIKTLAIHTAIVYVANFIIDIVVYAVHYGFYGDLFPIGGLIWAIIVGLISGAILGILFYFLFTPVHNWIKHNMGLSKYIYNIFTLFWVPILIVTVISFLLSLLGLLGYGGRVMATTYGYGASFFGVLLVSLLIGFIAHLIVYYFYSKTVSSKLSSHYPW